MNSSLLIRGAVPHEWREHSMALLRLAREMAEAGYHHSPEHAEAMKKALVTAERRFNDNWEGPGLKALGAFWNIYGGSIEEEPEFRAAALAAVPQGTPVLPRTETIDEIIEAAVRENSSDPAHPDTPSADWQNAFVFMQAMSRAYATMAKLMIEAPNKSSPAMRDGFSVLAQCNVWAPSDLVGELPAPAPAAPHPASPSGRPGFTWAGAFQIMMVGLENGTDEGKRLAREEMMKTAALLDKLLEKQDLINAAEPLKNAAVGAVHALCGRASRSDALEQLVATIKAATGGELDLTAQAQLATPSDLDSHINLLKKIQRLFDEEERILYDDKVLPLFGELDVSGVIKGLECARDSRPVETLQMISARIESLLERTAENEFIDTGEALELFQDFKNAADECLPPAAQLPSQQHSVSRPRRP